MDKINIVDDPAQQPALPGYGAAEEVGILEIANAIASVARVDPGMIGALYQRLVESVQYELRQGHAVRFQGVGLIVAVPTSNGHRGRVFRSPMGNHYRNAKQSHIVKRVLHAKGMEEMNLPTIQDAWRSLGDQIRQALNGQYTVRLSGIGKFVPGTKGARNARYEPSNQLSIQLHQRQLMRELDQVEDQLV